MFNIKSLLRKTLIFNNNKFKRLVQDKHGLLAITRQDNSRSGCFDATHLSCYEAKRSSLESKIRLWVISAAKLNPLNPDPPPPFFCKVFPFSNPLEPPDSSYLTFFQLGGDKESFKRKWGNGCF
jgi:hypothetical protein